MNYRSDKIDLLLTALSAAQGTYKALIPNQNSSSGPYANLAAVLDAVRDSLAANGLSIYHQEQYTAEGNFLWTIVGHSSGQFNASCTKIIQGKHFRDTFNSIESHKRHNAQNLLGIAPSPNDPLFVDDNGEGEIEDEQIMAIKKGIKPSQSHFPECINKDQYKDLLFELEDFDNVAEDIMNYYKIKSLSDLPKSEYHTALGRIRKIKRTYEDYNNRKAK